MVIVLKICIFIYLVVILFIAHNLYKDYKVSKTSKEYDEANLFGKIIINSSFYILVGAILSLATFIINILFSKITIEWVF